MSKHNLIFIPGLGCTHEIWQEIYKTMDAKYNCYIHVLNQTTLEDNINKIISSYSEPFSIVGHSIGAWTALAVAAHAPKKVERLVSLAGWARSQPNMAEFLTSMQAEALNGNIALFHKNQRAGAIWDKHPNYVEIDLKMKSMQESMSNEQYLSQARTIINDHAKIQDQLGKIKAESLIVHAEHDNFFPQEEAKFIHANLSTSKSTTVKNSGHMLPLEAKDEVQQLLTEFL